MATFISQWLFIELSTRPSRFVSDSHVMLQGEGDVTGNTNRLSSVFPGRKQGGETQTGTYTYTPTGWKQASRKHSTQSADWHIESASNVLKLHVTFVRLSSVTVSHNACACIHRCVNITSIPTNTYMNTSALEGELWKELFYIGRTL